MKNKLNLNPAFACNINLTNNIIMFYLFIDLSVLSAPSFTCCMISYVCFVQISWFSDSILGVVEERSLSMWDIYIYISECLVEMLTMVLINNNFTFDWNHYLQINRTAMRTKMALSYANICMGDLEERLLLSSLKQPLSWFRFIDDVDMKWIDSDKELDDFSNMPTVSIRL